MNIKTIALALVALLCAGTIFAYRATEIATYPIDDFDTNEVMKILRGATPDGARLMLGLAHPGMLSVTTMMLRSAVMLGANPWLAWSATLIAALMITCAIAFLIANQHGRYGRWRGVMAVALILASPITQDIARRSEENLITQAVFMACIAVLMMELKRTIGPRPLILAASSAALMAQHLQASLVFTSGAVLFLLVNRSSQHSAIEGRTMRVVVASLCLPPLAYMFLLKSSGLVDLARHQRDYAAHFHSMVNNDGLADYCASYLMFLKGYITNGLFDFEWINGQTHPRSARQAVGAFIAVIVLLLCRKGLLLDCLCLGGLAFPFLYEPSSSERWDTFLLPFALKLTTSTTGTAKWEQSTQFVIAAALLSFNLTHL